MSNFIRNFLFGGPGAATRFGDIGLALARIGLGAFLAIGHGYGKIFAADGSFGPSEQFVGGVAAMGFPMPIVFAWMAALTEFLGGTLLALGLFTRPIALALAFNMAVAAFVAHAADPFFTTGGRSKEFALLYFIPFVMFFFTGAGRFAIDALLRGRKGPRPAFEVGTKR